MYKSSTLSPSAVALGASGSQNSLPPPRITIGCFRFHNRCQNMLCLTERHIASLACSGQQQAPYWNGPETVHSTFNEKHDLPTYAPLCSLATCTTWPRIDTYHTTDSVSGLSELFLAVRRRTPSHSLTQETCRRKLTRRRFSLS